MQDAMDARQRIQRNIFDLRNAMSIYLQYGNVEAAEKCRAMISGLARHLEVLRGWERDRIADLERKKQNLEEKQKPEKE